MNKKSKDFSTQLTKTEPFRSKHSKKSIDTRCDCPGPFKPRSSKRDAVYGAKPVVVVIKAI